jgi:hypothetical protein
MNGKFPAVVGVPIIVTVFVVVTIVLFELSAAVPLFKSKPAGSTPLIIAHV